MPDRKPAEQPSNGYANYVLGVLFLVYVFNFIDRQLLSVFIGPIKAEFGASDTAMGLLVGFAFALLYSVAGIPIARLADRRSRRNIIAIGLALWSAMTVATGFARSFVQLAIARVFVGIGEAAGSPPSHSLIADYFPLNRRATAFAIYAAGAFIGAALAYLGGGYLREYLDWRTAFIVVGAPGLLIALLVRFTVREPRRGLSEQRTEEAGTSTLAETLGFLARSRSWLCLVAGFSLISVTNYAVLMWGFEFYGRVHGMAPITIGNWLGIIIGVGGVIGVLIGGRVFDRLVQTSPKRALYVPALVALAGFPLGLCSMLADSGTASLAFFLPFYLLINGITPAMYSHNQALARLHMRATAAAMMVFIVNIISAGGGPLLVGALSDAFRADFGVESIRYALVCSLGVGMLGVLFLLLAGLTLDRDLERARGAAK